MTSQPTPVNVGFPLDGEWIALRTPAAAVPTHGTNFLGQRYAYDFVRPGAHWWAPFGAPTVAHGLLAAPASSFAAWDAPVYAATDGRVVRAVDGCPDQRWLNAVWDVGRLLVVQRFRPVRVSQDDWRPLTGNYVMIEGDAGVTLYAHLRNGSLRVESNAIVRQGDRIGAVGNSGRSSMPHLHFHLMDRANGFNAKGLLCGFLAFEAWLPSGWIVRSGVPELRERIRGVRSARVS